MPPQRATRPRQDPVSCESCRKKKLKCDREVPCSNCRTRGLQCTLQDYHLKPVALGTETELRAENAAIRSRLRRLEEAVFHGQQTGSSIPAQPPGLGPVTDMDLATSTDGSHTLTTCEDNTPTTDQARNYTADTRWLEEVTTSGSLQLPRATSRIHFRITPLHEIIRGAPSETLLDCILLPGLEESHLLFHHYIEDLDSLQHIIYIPTVTFQINLLYASLMAGRMPEHSHAALLLAILSSVTAYWSYDQTKQSQSFIPNPPQAISVARYWLRCAVDCLEQIWRLNCPDVTTIQSTIIIVFLMYHIDGVSSKLRHLHSAAIAQAKEIGLHMTDSTQFRAAEETREQIIDAEIRRRIWWHLASTDWSMAIIGGPYEGVYTIQRRHMEVKRPRHVNDEDLAVEGSSFSRPMTEFTSTTYYLHRINVGEVCREIADISWELLAVRDPGQIDYERIVELDGKIARLLQDMPALLNVDSSNHQHLITPDLERPSLTKQRYFTYLTIMARRAKLHIPFLLRATHDKRYSFSRQVCLQSARNILSLRCTLPFSRPTSPDQVRLIAVCHHFFIATTVLVLDLLVNNTIGHEQEQRLEVQAACRAFEEARKRSSAANKFLDSLLALLRKHGVSLSDAPGQEFQVSSEDMIARVDGLSTTVDANNPDAFDLDGILSSFVDFGGHADVEEWEKLFNEFDGNYM